MTYFVIRTSFYRTAALANPKMLGTAPLRVGPMLLAVEVNTIVVPNDRKVLNVRGKNALKTFLYSLHVYFSSSDIGNCNKRLLLYYYWPAYTYCRVARLATVSGVCRRLSSSSVGSVTLHGGHAGGFAAQARR